MLQGPVARKSAPPERLRPRRRPAGDITQALTAACSPMRRRLTLVALAEKCTRDLPLEPDTVREWSATTAASAAGESAYGRRGTLDDDLQDEVAVLAGGRAGTAAESNRLRRLDACVQQQLGDPGGRAKHARPW